MLTSHPEENLSQRCRELGADVVFDKANDIEQLVAYCKTLAGGPGSRPLVHKY